MGWWQDFKETRDYYRKLDTYRQQGQELRTELKRIEDTTPNHQDRDRAMLRYRDAHAESFSTAKPKAPEKMSALGRWFSRKSVPTKEEEATLSNTEHLFSNDIANITNREVQQIKVDKREAAIGKGAQVRAQYTRDHLLPEVEQMGNHARAVTDAHHEALIANYGDVNAHLEQKDIDRLSHSMMVPPASQDPSDVAAAATQNGARLMHANALAMQIKARKEGSPDFNQGVFDRSVQAVAADLKPAVQRINDFDLTQINTDNPSWVTAENLQAMHTASQFWMPVSDLKKPGRDGTQAPCPELLDALGVNNPEFIVRARMMDTAQLMVRGRIAQDLGDSATKADYAKLVNPNTNRETSLLGVPNNPNPTMESISRGFATVTAGTNAGFNKAKDYQGMVTAANLNEATAGRAPLDLQQLNHPQIPQPGARKMDVQQLGELTGSAPKPKASQIPQTPPQKGAVQNTSTRKGPRS